LPKVLVIDDNEEVRETLRAVLDSEGYIPIIAANAQEGIRAFADERPDVVIMDIIMPKADGNEAIRTVRMLDPAAKIIAMSGGSLGSKDYLQVASSLGATAILPKPFEVEDLIRLIRSCLDPTPDASA
jgi:two-component system, chemotaxis family, chemotaxis protein CheY